MTRLDAIKRRLKEATPGPWHEDSGIIYPDDSDSEDGDALLAVQMNDLSTRENDANLALAAHTHEDLALTVELLEKAMGALEAGICQVRPVRGFMSEHSPECKRCVALTEIRARLEGE